MSVATEYRQQSLIGRLPGKRAYRRNAVNTGFHGTSYRDNYRSLRIKDSVLIDDTCGMENSLIYTNNDRIVKVEHGNAKYMEVNA